MSSFDPVDGSEQTWLRRSYVGVLIWDNARWLWNCSSMGIVIDTSSCSGDYHSWFGHRIPVNYRDPFPAPPTASPKLQRSPTFPHRVSGVGLAVWEKHVGATRLNLNATAGWNNTSEIPEFCKLRLSNQLGEHRLGEIYERTCSSFL